MFPKWKVTTLEALGILQNVYKEWSKTEPTKQDDYKFEALAKHKEVALNQFRELYKHKSNPWT